MVTILSDENIAGGVGSHLLEALESPHRGSEQPPPKLGLEEVRSSDSLLASGR